MHAPKTNTTVGKNQGCRAATSARAADHGGQSGSEPSVAKSLRRCRPHGRGGPRGGDSRPDLERLRALVHQHAEPVGARQCPARAPGRGGASAAGCRSCRRPLPRRGTRARSAGAGSAGAEPGARRVDDERARQDTALGTARVDRLDRDRRRRAGQGARSARPGSGACGSRSRAPRTRPQALDGGAARGAARAEEHDGGAAQADARAPRGRRPRGRSRPCCTRASPGIAQERVHGARLQRTGIEACDQADALGPCAGPSG